MDEQKFFEQGAIVAQTGLGEQEGLLAGVKLKHAADAFLLAGKIEFVNGTVVGGIGPRFDASADAMQSGVGFLEGVFGRGVETKILQWTQRQQTAELPDGITEGRPFAAGCLQQAYFVFFEEDEIAVRICAETALGCRRAEASERFQSSLVIVLKSASFDRAGEAPTLEEGGFAGELVLHGSAIYGRSASSAWLAK